MTMIYVPGITELARAYTIAEMKEGYITINQARDEFLSNHGSAARFAEIVKEAHQAGHKLTVLYAPPAQQKG